MGIIRIVSKVRNLFIHRLQQGFPNWDPIKSFFPLDAVHREGPIKVVTQIRVNAAVHALIGDERGEKCAKVGNDAKCRAHSCCRLAN